MSLKRIALRITMARMFMERLAGTGRYQGMAYGSAQRLPDIARGLLREVLRIDKELEQARATIRSLEDDLILVSELHDEAERRARLMTAFNWNYWDHVFGGKP